MAKRKVSKKKSARSSARPQRRATKKSSTKNSLVGNINKRKKAGTSRSKKDSTISQAAYEDMQQGWPKKEGRKGKKKRAAGKSKA